MLWVKAKTLRDAWIQLNMQILERPHEVIEDCTSSYAFIDGGIVYVESGTDQGLNLGEVGYSRAKWKHLLRGYFLPESFEAAVRAGEHYLGRPQRPPLGIVFFGDRIHKSPGISSAAGPCLVGFTLAWRFADPTPRCHVLSRSTESSRKLYADLVLVQVLLRTLGKRLGFDPRGVPIAWIFARITQTVDFVPAFLKLAGRELPKIDHPWIKAIERSWPTEKDLASKFRTRKVAVEHYFHLMEGKSLENIPASTLYLPGWEE